MTVSKVTGVYCCFNPSCGEAGVFNHLVSAVTKKNEYEVLRFIASHRTGEPDFEKIMASVLADDGPKEIEPYPLEKLQEMQDNFWKSQVAMDYMHGRGFNDFVLAEFKIGYSEKKNLITVPVFADDGMFVGFVGRTPGEKGFKNSGHLPRNQLIYNGQTAKRGGGTILVTEAAFDTMSFAQVGLKNSGALLGGVLSRAQAELLDRNYERIIICTDFDEKQFYPNCKKCPDRKCIGHNPGRDLGMKIASALPSKEIFWACYSDTEVYPGGAKDISAISESDRLTVVQNARPHFEYLLLDLY